MIGLFSLNVVVAQSVGKQSVGALLRSEFYGASQKLRNSPNEPWHGSTAVSSIGTLSTATSTSAAAPTSNAVASATSAASASASPSVAPSSSTPVQPPAPAHHEHYKAQMGLSCILQKSVKVTVKDDSGKMVTLSCSDPILQLSDLIINEVRGPFCACVSSAEEYCELKRVEIRADTADTLQEMHDLGFDPCYKCGEPFCNASYFSVDGRCSDPHPVK